MLATNRQAPQALPVIFGEFGMRLDIDDAQRAQRKAVGRAERDAGIEADIGCRSDQGIVEEARIPGPILDDHHLVLGDGMGAERDAAAHIDRLDANARGDLHHRLQAGQRMIRS